MCQRRTKHVTAISLSISVHFFDSRFPAVPAISKELGLKGNVDCIVEATTKLVSSQFSKTDNTETSLMSIELKTGHNQKTQRSHLAQLCLYSLMLQTRYGVDVVSQQPRSLALKSTDTTGGGMLLYLNHESVSACHVQASLDETKALIMQRNTLACATAKAAQPRGVLLSYEDDDADDDTSRIKLSEPTPIELPEVLRDSFPCSKCYAARECTTYSAVELSSIQDPVNSAAPPIQPDFLERFTGLLDESDFSYFRTWDRLLDLEEIASKQSISEAWLEESTKREISTGQCISSLVYDEQQSHIEGGLRNPNSPAIICLKRAPDSLLHTPLCNLKIETGCFLTISTDTTTLDACNFKPGSYLRPNNGSRIIRPFRFQMHVFRGVLVRADKNHIFVRASQDELGRVLSIISRYRDSASSSEDLKWRADKDDLSCGIGTLRQNLVNLLTKDREQIDKQKKDQDLRRLIMEKRLGRLRNFVIRLNPPTFSEDLKAQMFNPKTEIPTLPGCDFMDLLMEFVELNVDQRAAVEKTMSTNDYTLIQG